jgi:Notch-like protein
LVNNYNCVCKPGWMGQHCETKKNFCQGNPCHNGGVCTNQEGSHHCACSPGFIGPNCQFTGTSCDSSPCRNGGTCVNSGDGSEFACLCPAGTTGRTCEQDTRNECTYNPCKNGQCIDRVGDYDCSCQTEWRGKNCDIPDMASPGGIDKTNGRYEIVDVYLEKQKCIDFQCERKAKDNRCDEECNTHTCAYDGGDCRLGVNPWKFCNATSRGSACWDVFQDDYCDEACNNKGCLFDGRDCEAAKLECNPNYDVYCSDHYGNGHCDASCNNAACGWDGLDCEATTEHHQIIPGSFYVVLTLNIKRFDEAMQKRFERYLSLVLRTNFKIRRNADGSPMVYDFNPAAMMGHDSDYAFNTNLVLQGNLGIIVYLEIDNVKCQQETMEHCYDDAEGYANLFSAMMGAEKLSDDWGIVQVGAKSVGPNNGETGPSVAGIVVGAIIICLVVVVVYTLNKKKRARGIQWFPENFTLTGGAASFHGPRAKKARRDNQEMTDQRYASTVDMERWSEDDPLEQAKQRQQDYASSDQTIMTTDYENDNDSRTWTQQHMNAADIRNPDILGALTPPQGEVAINEMMTNDVNGRGPMGMTPLMIASFRGTGLDTGDIETFDDLEDSSPAVIQDLIAQGAKLNAQMDKTGETPLHLAARYARADAAKRLLDAGDDAIANAQDNTGRTPLHAAVAADALGVFHILLKNRCTNLDAKTSDGTSPLMLAARLAIEGMVEQLIEANADVNIADDNGKTGLHWAASVNNVEAVNILLKNQANRDAQDHKDETPLFLAAREGSYQAARALLDHGANREIQDHMDRLPVHVAHERMHQDIVTLLEEYPSPAQMPGAMNPFSSQPMLSTTGSPPGGHLMMQTHTQMRMKKPAKKDMDNNSMTSSTLPRQQARRQSSVKQQQRGKKSGSPSMLSPEHSPYEQNFGNTGHNLAISHPNLEDLISKQPPSYEAAVARSVQGGMPGQQPLESQYSNFNPQQQQQLAHNRQQSMPASVSSTYSNHLSPPHSNLSSHHVQSPPHSTGAMSPPNPAVMSPPQSVTMSPPQASHHSMSPPHQQQPQHHSSPVKSRTTQLPTSPTHLQALRGATHQRHQASFDFTNAAPSNNADIQMFMAVAQQQFLYPTPPHSQPQGGQQQMHESSFMSPSPDSPGQWSSASPQSHSDWSEGIHSPPSGHFQQQQQQQQQHHQQQLQQQQLMHQQTDAVII